MKSTSKDKTLYGQNDNMINHRLFIFIFFNKYFSAVTRIFFFFTRTVTEILNTIKFAIRAKRSNTTSSYLVVFIGLDYRNILY